LLLVWIAACTIIGCILSIKNFISLFTETKDFIELVEGAGRALFGPYIAACLPIGWRCARPFHLFIKWFLLDFAVGCTKSFGCISVVFMWLLFYPAKFFVAGVLGVFVGPFYIIYLILKLIVMQFKIRSLSINTKAAAIKSIILIVILIAVMVGLLTGIGLKMASDSLLQNLKDNRPVPTPTPYSYRYTPEKTPVKSPTESPIQRKTVIPSELSLNKEKIENMQLKVGELETVKLKDGSYERTGRDYLEVKITDMAWGDLDNDGKEDAAVIYRCSYGGSGVFYHLTTIIDNNGDILQCGNEDLNVYEVKSVFISSGKIYIKFFMRGETKVEEYVYRLEGGKLSLTSAEVTPVKTSAEEYIIQVGVFGDRDNAEKLITKLKGKGYGGTIVVLDNGRSYSYRVQAGAFTTKDEADKLKNKLKADGIDAIVKKLEAAGQEIIMTTPDGQNSIRKIPSSDITITCSDQKTETEASRDYGADLTLDGERETAWNTEGSYGKWIKYSFDKNISCVKIGILPGYDKYEDDEYGDRWYNNNRVTAATLVFSDGTTKSINFTGNREIEYFEFVTPINTSFVKIEINEISRGNKFDDTCISEVEIYSSI